MELNSWEDILPENGWEKRFINAANNAHTRRARLTDMLAFVHILRDVDSNGKPRCQFPAYYLVKQQPEYARKVLLQYQKQLIRQKLAPSTINRRLATVRAWVRFAQKEMFTPLSPDGLIGELAISPEKHEPKIDAISLSHICIQPDVTTLRGLRDGAMLQLICEVPFVGWQLCSLRVCDVSMMSSLLRIPIGGSSAKRSADEIARGSLRDEQRMVRVKVSSDTLGRIHEYLSQNHLQDKTESPLFINFDRRPDYAGTELVPKSILHLVKEYGKRIGLPNLNPRIIRESVIVKTLEEANWNASLAHRRFPHVGLHTWFRYARNAE